MKIRLCSIVGALFLTAIQLGAEDRMSKDFTVGENPQLILEADVAHLEVVKGERGKIKASIKVPDRDEFRISSTQNGDRVRIRLEHKGILSWLKTPWYAIGGDEVVIRVEVPYACDLDLSTDVGRINVTEVSGTIDVSTSSGVVELRKVEDDVRVTSSSGAIKIDEFEGELYAEVNVGTINLKNSTGVFNLESNTGRIEVRNSSGQFRITSNVGTIDFEGTITGGENNYLRSDVGSVKVTLNNQKNLDIDAETDLGKVSIYPKPTKVIANGERYLTAQIGKGGPKLRIRSDVGSIDIEEGSILTPQGESEDPEEIELIPEMSPSESSTPPTSEEPIPLKTETEK